MLKRTALLLVLAALLFTTSSAFASHCWRCRAKPSTGEVGCAQAINFFPGHPICTEDVVNGQDVCEVSGTQCTHALAMAPLATDFQIVSVERIDEAPRPAETHLASR